MQFDMLFKHIPSLAKAGHVHVHVNLVARGKQRCVSKEGPMSDSRRKKPVRSNIRQLSFKLLLDARPELYAVSLGSE